VTTGLIKLNTGKKFSEKDSGMMPLLTHVFRFEPVNWGQRPSDESHGSHNGLYHNKTNKMRVDRKRDTATR